MPPLRVPSTLTATWAVCSRHVSPSTSALNPHPTGTGRRECATCWASWMPHAVGGGDGEVARRSRTCLPFGGLGPSRTRKLKASVGLRA